MAAVVRIYTIGRGMRVLWSTVFVVRVGCLRRPLHYYSPPGRSLGGVGVGGGGIRVGLCGVGSLDRIMAALVPLAVLVVLVVVVVVVASSR